MDSKARNKIIKARAGLVLDQPFFGSLALRLALKEDLTCKTAWTDGLSLGYNPTFISELSLDECKGLLAHEVMHCACAHMARRDAREPKKWNISADYAINGIIEESGFKLPAGRLRESAYDHKSADEIYGIIPDNPLGVDQGNDPGGCGEVRDAKGPDGQQASAADLNQAEQDWKIAASQAAQQAKVMGNLPAGIARLVDELLNPKVDWREVLRRFIQTNARNDYSWQRPNRRYIHQGLYLPSLYREQLGDIVLAVDTSGSIAPADLNQFAAEMTSILEEFPGSMLHVVYCDTEVSNTETFSHDDLPFDLHPAGGGGTDFRPPFGWTDQQGIAPACLVYLTDGECSRYPESPPDYPVLWVGTADFTPEFGDFVRL